MTQTVTGEYEFAGLPLSYEVEFSDDLVDTVSVLVKHGGTEVDAGDIWIRSFHGLKTPTFETLEYHIILAAGERAQDERPSRESYPEK